MSKKHPVYQKFVLFFLSSIADHDNNKNFDNLEIIIPPERPMRENCFLNGSIMNQLEIEREA